MPTLDWFGKSSVLEHHKQVPYRLLEYREDLSVGNAESGNLLIQGDNLEALKALLPYYAGQVMCIYLDPPYNTGNENWVYNDNVHGLEMREWLRKAVTTNRVPGGVALFVPLLGYLYGYDVLREMVCCRPCWIGRLRESCDETRRSDERVITLREPSKKEHREEMVYVR